MTDPLPGHAILGIPFIADPAVPDGFVVAIGPDPFGFPELKAIVKLECKETDHRWNAANATNVTTG